ncbi:CoA ester lyase [candidate division KSB1 bacterium]|nr:CoA ester lyase [candidate division KSB1 bacterium]
MEIRRSILSVPGHIVKMHDKAAHSEADVIMFDLEDSVPVGSKKVARENIVDSIRRLDWSGKLLSLRINAVDTSFAYGDVIYCVEHCGSMLRSLVLPKVNHEGDIHFLARLLNGIESNLSPGHPISIEACIETAQGLERISRIAEASSRLKSLVFGIADFTASIGAPLTTLSAHGEDDTSNHSGHRWHYILNRIVTAAKSHGLYAIDAPYGNFQDEEGLIDSARMSRLLGFDGKWVIHPGQISIVNEAYSPSEHEIELAKQILEAHKEAEINGRGAASKEGHMIDNATVRLAEKVWEFAIQLGNIAS